MINQHRFVLLTSVMAGVALLVASVTIGLLYQVGFEQQSLRLQETVRSHASLIEAMAAFNQSLSQSEAFQDTMSQIEQGHQAFSGFGETGEYTIARRVGDNMMFMLRHKGQETSKPTSVPYHSTLAEPMRQALQGNSGVMIGDDYRGVRVLAAYEPLVNLNSGLVVKVDLKEIRSPFVLAALVALLTTLVLVLAAGCFFWLQSNPILHSLKEKESRLQAVIDTAVDAIITIDKNGIVDTFSKNAEKLFGYEKSEVIGRNIKMLMPPARAAAHDGYLQHYLTTGEKKIIGIGREVIGQRKDKSQFPMNLAVSEFQINGRRCFTGIIRDLTQQKLAEEDLKRAESEAGQLRERLAHLGRLSSMGEMATGIAHEVNQPLSAIASYVQASIRMLKNNSITPDELATVLDKVAKQAHRAGEVIRRLRSFIKKQDSQHQTIDANELVREISDLLEPEARLQNLKLKLKLSGSALFVNVDPVQIQQVILNLVRNSFESFDQLSDVDPTILVTTHLSVSQEEEPLVIIKVEDQGCGLDAGSACQVFEPFYTTKKHGMGMGLSISRTILSAHGGSLQYRPNEPKGSVFTISLPVAIRNECEVEPSEERI